MWKPRLPGLHWLFFVLAIYMLVFVKDTEIASKDLIAGIFAVLGVLSYLHRRFMRWRNRRHLNSMDHHLRRALDHDAPHPPEGI